MADFLEMNLGKSGCSLVSGGDDMGQLRCKSQL